METFNFNRNIFKTLQVYNFKNLTISLYILETLFVQEMLNSTPGIDVTNETLLLLFSIVIKEIYSNIRLSYRKQSFELIAL